ncbi:efflux RND transporter periplasmic adaptor subunit [Altererythrobacter fulvus]|uniref:efflux RND transporter periplasmic adaptor subunit n=1 Tax=Caenibius fulvus TaxID=2126012 RepID=UPI003018C6FB
MIGKTHLRLGIAAALLALPLAGCGSSESEPAQVQKAEGERFTVQLADTGDWKDVSAEISTVDQAQVLARIPGILTSLSVKEGDLVRKGQVIGRIVDSQLGYQAGAFGAQAAAAQAQAAAAKAELERVQFLYDNGVYAKARLDQARAAADAAQAQVSAARQQQGAVNAVAGQGAVVAPASGRVLLADVPAGSPVAPGMPIAVITAGAIVLKLELPESLAAQVHPGSRVLAQMPGAADVTGTIVKLYPAVMGGKVRADVEIAGLDGSLIGRRISAKVEAGSRKALLVPADYVTTAYGLDTVWAVGKDGSAASVPVQTAPSTEKGKVEILSGLSAGDVIVKQAAK